jgi:hypothetical protein
LKSAENHVPTAAVAPGRARFLVDSAHVRELVITVDSVVSAAEAGWKV